MRKIKFIVNGQIISIDPNCNLDGLVPGTEGYLAAEFIFSNEWKELRKVVGFWSALGREYKPQVLDSRNVCIIPKEALNKRTFKVQVLGSSQDGTFGLSTNKIAVSQNGGKK